MTPDDVVATYLASMMRLCTALEQDIERAREALAQLLGTITVEADDEGVVAEMTTRPDRVLLAVAGAQLGLVAGVGNPTYLRTLMIR
jgi:hypothetical protein